MSKSENHNISQSSTKPKVITPPLLLLFGVSTLAYYLIVAAIYALFGERVAGWLANALFGIAVFFIARWDASRTQQDIGWREYIKFPQLKLRKLIIISLTIFSIQNIAGFISVRYLESTRPDLITDDFVDVYYAQFDTWGSSIIILTGLILSCFLGGYVAGKLSPYKYLAPYSHAAVGAIIVHLINSITMQFLLVCKCGTPPSQEEIGWLVVVFPPIMLLTLLGTWVKIRPKLSRNKENTDSLSSTSRYNVDSETSVARTSSEQRTTGIAEKEGLKLRAFIQKQKRRKKRKRR